MLESNNFLPKSTTYQNIQAEKRKNAFVIFVLQ